MAKKTSDYTTVNPLQQVPSIEVNGQTLTQSVAIIEFLEETYPSPALLPKDVFKRAKVREICEVIGSGIQPLQTNSGVLKKIGDEKKTEWAQFWIEKGFVALEKMLQKTAGKYSVGDEITMADLFLVPQVDNAKRFSVPMETFPTIARINEECSKLDAFKAASPFVQSDCPEDLRAK
ncbi:hypothetical protein KUTeg_014839 [Tegillarca granosa]|uniref:maleylacetoacetate isomerase n=1 Tax=Tegillarca granosa TaxID=220873 RepID=A0ABQ9EQW6_TEGGR|nr:hypothetical protein KUTeg_014839 [Tegillarca granosa]